MNNSITTPESVSTWTGIVVLSATTFATVIHYGGFFSVNTPMIIALGAGVFAGGRALGAARTGKGKIVAAIIAGLLAGEAYNFITTAEITIDARNKAVEPLRKAQKKHDDAVKRLHDLETSEPTSLRLKLAQKALAAVKDAAEPSSVTAAQAALDAANLAVVEESRDGCKTVCKQKQAIAAAKQKALDDARAMAVVDRRAAVEKADRDVTSALDLLAVDHAKDVEAARAAVEASPEPTSSTPLSDTTGIPAWAIDLGAALLKSLACNGLAAALIAYGARRPDDSGQSDFSFAGSATSEAVRFFRPDSPEGPNNTRNSGPDRPGKPGPSSGLSKSEALDDLLHRLAIGQTIPSDSLLAADWNRPKQTVHDWMKAWRTIGVVPAPTRVGRCKQTTAV